MHWDVRKMGVRAGQLFRILFARRSVFVRLDDLAAPMSCPTLCCLVQPVRTDRMSSRDGGFKSELFLGPLDSWSEVSAVRRPTASAVQPLPRAVPAPALTGLSVQARHFCISVFLYFSICQISVFLRYLNGVRRLRQWRPFFKRLARHARVRHGRGRQRNRRV